MAVEHVRADADALRRVNRLAYGFESRRAVTAVLDLCAERAGEEPGIVTPDGPYVMVDDVLAAVRRGLDG